MPDILVTWPKGRPLDSYLNHLARAKETQGELAFFRTSSRPDTGDGDRCYHVHDGFVRGYLLVVAVVEFKENAPVDQVTGAQFRPGLYVARKPDWHPIWPVEMRGFQGFRYVQDRGEYRAI